MAINNTLYVADAARELRAHLQKVGHTAVFKIPHHGWVTSDGGDPTDAGGHLLGLPHAAPVPWKIFLGVQDAEFRQIVNLALSGQEIPAPKPEELSPLGWGDPEVYWEYVRENEG